MINRKVLLSLAGAVLALTSMPYAMAQEAMDGDFSDQTATMGEGDMFDIAALAASLPAPDPSVFAALSNAGSNVQIAEGPGGPPGHGPGGPGGPHHWGGGMPWMHSPLSGALALSDDQYEKLNSIKNSSADAMAPKHTQLHTAYRDLCESLGKQDIDTAKVKSLQAQIASLKSDMSMAETNKLVQMAQVLSGDQRHALHMAMVKGALFRDHMHMFHHH
jgi:Spy/CpxP family protein refolding chaperone